jgi:hypothetical protein
VGTIRDYSDTLLIFMLKARRPQKFRERIAEHARKNPEPTHTVQTIIGIGGDEILGTKSVLEDARQYGPILDRLRQQQLGQPLLPNGRCDAPASGAT